MLLHMNEAETNNIDGGQNKIKFHNYPKLVLRFAKVPSQKTP